MKSPNPDTGSQLSFKIGRRVFLSGGAALILSATLPGLSSCGRQDDNEHAGAALPDGDVDFKDWVQISTDGTITIYSAPSEMGQGSMTACPLIIADEMDADWNDVKVEFSPPVDEIYANPEFNSMLTIASISVSGYFEGHRLVGAQCRKAIKGIAARHWDVPTKELKTRLGVVTHQQSNRSLTYAEIVEIADVESVQLDSVTSADFKSSAENHLIGTDVQRLDIAEKSDGSALYAIDIDLPLMLYAAIARNPIIGTIAEEVDDSAARAVAGVRDIIDLEHGVAVIAETQWAAFKAKERLNIKWSEVGDTSHYSSRDGAKMFAAAVSDLAQTGYEWERVGQISREFAENEDDVDVEVRTYQTAYNYHAQMEPLNAVARINDDGRVEVWAGTQAPSFAVRMVARAMDVSENDVVLHRMYLGGGFGRRAVREQEYVVDAAVLAKRCGAPVKVVWTREDDVKAGRFRPMSAQFLAARTDDNGDITHWLHRVASEEASRMQDPFGNTLEKGVPELSMYSSDKRNYGYPNRLVEHVEQFTGMRVAPMRGIGVTPHFFSSESFIDELAGKHQKDPLDYRLQLLRNSPRGTAVMRRVAEMSDWGSKTAGRAKGVAFSDYHDSFAGFVAEVSVDDATHKIRVHNLWIAYDPGTVVQPDNAISQIEGGAIFGLSNSLLESIQIEDGKVVNSNYYDYPVMRMRDVPEIHVDLIPSGDKPSGLGETGAVAPAAAVANAFAALTGKRIRRLPMDPASVKEALGA